MSRTFRTAVLLAAALVGCQGGDVPEAASNAVPEPPVAPALPDGEITAGELRERLGANGNAQFVRSGGGFEAVELYGSDATTIEPLRGLPIQALGISGLPIESLAPLRGMPLEQLTAEGTPVSDLSPLRGAPLRELYLRETRVKDLSPLAGMPLEKLNVVGTPVDDVSAVKSLPLDTLWIASTAVRDLSPLAGMRLASLDVERTPVSDLTPLAKMTSLKRLNVAESDVTDLTPLRGLELERLILTPSRITAGLEVVRSMPTLATVGTSLDAAQPAERFWADYDAGRISESAP